jgi:SPP1 gp7 family putative phage head morphogenesis protein
MIKLVLISMRIKMKIKNETEIQLMRILFKTSGKRATKKITSPRAYPHGIERKYYRQLQSFFKPLTDYVKKFIDENMEELLRGDSSDIHLDAIPGDSFRNMIYNLEDWISVYMPDISELPADSNNNVIFTSIAETADDAMKFGNKEFAKTLDKGIHVNMPTSAAWWNDMKSSWAEDNYTLITSNAKNYVSKINTLTEQAIVNGMAPGKLKEEIYKATDSLSKSHCRLLARDQMGKLNGQITQAQMEEIGLDMYVWSTAFDDRVRDSHAAMEGLLCRWDDASVCSYDGGKTWVPRPSDAITLHPGQDIQCRCVGLAYYPELTAEIENTPMEYISAAETEDSVSNYQSIIDKIDSFKETKNGEIDNIIPMGTKNILLEAAAIYNRQRATGQEIYVEKMVDLNDIVTRQEWLDKDTLLGFMKYDKSKEKGDIIRAVEYKGKYMLIDGNHRVAMALLKDGKRLKIAVLNPIETE